LKILISAFACQPGQGSEPGLGWGVVTQAARRHRVIVLADAHNKDLVRGAPAGRPPAGVHFIFLGLPVAYRRLEGIKFLGYAYYFLWQLVALRIARRLHKKLKFDLVHHATYANCWAPSLLGYLGIPFVCTAGGRDVTPLSFLEYFSWRGRISEILRNFAVRWLGRLANKVAASRAAVTLTSSAPDTWPRQVVVERFPLGALDESELAKLNSVGIRQATCFRIASIGKLLALKGFGLGLFAFARLLRQYPESEYWIIGSGPEERWLRKLAARLGCADRVKLLGWMARDELFSVLAEVDVLLHPSLHEQFGYVVLEAMAAGRPVISLARGGCELLADSGGGRAIPVNSPGQVIDDLYKALLDLAANPENRRRAGARARQSAQAYWNWSEVGLRLEAVYQQALKSSYVLPARAITAVVSGRK